MCHVLWPLKLHHFQTIQILWHSPFQVLGGYGPRGMSSVVRSPLVISPEFSSLEVRPQAIMSRVIMSPLIRFPEVRSPSAHFLGGQVPAVSSPAVRPMEVRSLSLPESDMPEIRFLKVRFRWSGHLWSGPRWSCYQMYVFGVQVDVCNISGGLIRKLSSLLEYQGIVQNNAPISFLKMLNTVICTNVP